MGAWPWWKEQSVRRLPNKELRHVGWNAEWYGLENANQS
jgi:hypothetical protein